MAWLCLSDLTCFSSALVPHRLSFSIYNTENCWINSLAVPDLSCYSSSFEPCMSYCTLLLSLRENLSVSVCYALFGLQRRTRQMDDTEERSHWGFRLTCLFLFIPALPHSLAVSFFLSLSPCVIICVPALKSIPDQWDPDLSSSLLCFETSTACCFTKMIDFQLTSLADLTPMTSTPSMILLRSNDDCLTPSLSVFVSVYNKITHAPLATCLFYHSYPSLLFFFLYDLLPL